MHQRKAASLITALIAFTLPAPMHAEPMLTIYHARAANEAKYKYACSPSLLIGLGSTKAEERKAALESLEKIMGKSLSGPCLAKIRDAMIKSLSKEDPRARIDAARSLAIIKDRKALPALLDSSIGDADEGVRLEAARSIETISRE